MTKNPWPAILVAFLIGFLAGVFTGGGGDSLPGAAFDLGSVFFKQKTPSANTTSDNTKVNISQPDTELSKDDEGPSESHDSNFSVSSPIDNAKKIAYLAKYYRKRSAIEWLGEELPDGAGPTTIYVGVTKEGEESSGITRPLDEYSRFNHIWILVSPEDLRNLSRKFQSILGHEMCHAVLSTAYPELLPPWVLEGIACSGEPSEFLEKIKLERLLKYYVKRLVANDVGTKILSNQIVKIINEKRGFAKYEVNAHAISWSLVEYLIDLGQAQIQKKDKTKTEAEAKAEAKLNFIDFAIAGNKNENGWNNALKEHYGIKDVNELVKNLTEWLKEFVNSKNK